MQQVICMIQVIFGEWEMRRTIWFITSHCKNTTFNCTYYFRRVLLLSTNFGLFGQTTPDEFLLRSYSNWGQKYLLRTYNETTYDEDYFWRGFTVYISPIAPLHYLDSYIQCTIILSIMSISMTVCVRPQLPDRHLLQLCDVRSLVFLIPAAS